MKKNISIISILLCLVLVLSLFVACNPKNDGDGDGDKDTGIKEWESNEWVASDSALYRDYYHIFVYSFCDSDGDGIGDLKGIESKLDYIADLGFNGIWLSPIHPSDTEHCYDVKDYMDVNEMFGTLSDFDELVEAAHEKGISIMLDLVINHTSNKHPWFIAAQEACRQGKTSNKYYNYYTFKDSTGNSYKTFEQEQSMPKLNLDNQDVRNEIDEMCKFWLQGHSVDAFRLDAAWHFYDKNAAANVAFMQWLYATAKVYNPDVYMVGEVLAKGAQVYPHFAENSVQSFFNFDFSTSKGFNEMLVKISPGQTDRATSLAPILAANERNTAKGIDALFLSNHDTTRFSNQIAYINNRTMDIDEVKTEWHKMSVALLYTQPGNVFNYYGNEIGMRNGLRAANGDGYTSNSYIDYTYRTAMNWSNESTWGQTDGFAYKAYGYNSRFGEHDDYLGGVAEQINDQNSILNFYRRVMTLRRQNPEIAQGKSTFIANDDTDLLIVVRDYNGSKLLMIYNLHADSEVVFDASSIISELGLVGGLRGFLSSNNDRDVTMSGKTVTLPQFSLAVIY